MKTRYFCYDCGKSTGSTVAVWRGKGIFAFVHRAGQGCHKGQTSEQVRNQR